MDGRSIANCVTGFRCRLLQLELPLPMTRQPAEAPSGVRRQPTGPVMAVVLACLAIIGALLIYAPYAARPFDMRDFSEFVPLLKGDDSVFSQFERMLSYYATRGRANVIPYAAIVVKWKLFGWESEWWQLLRFLQMCLLVGTAFVVIRRFGAGVIGSSIGASLFIVGGSAAHGWVRLTMAEVVGTQLVLIGILFAMHVQRSMRWWLHVAGLAAVVAALVLAKEMFVAAIPFLLALALWWRSDDTLRFSRLSTRDVSTICAIGIAAIVTVVPMGIVALTAPAGAYTSTFGTAGVPWFRPVVWTTGALTPYLVISWQNPAWALAQLLVFIWVMATGLKELLRDTTARRHNIILLSILAAHVAAGAVLYLPWPVYQPFYAMPFFVATVVAAGLAVLGATRRARASRAYGGLAAAGWAFVLASATSQALDYRTATDAEQRFNAQLVRYIADQHTNFDSLVVVNKKPLRGARSWQGFGATIARYGNAMSLTMPSVVDEDCATAKARRATSRPSTMLLRYGNTCTAMGAPDTVLVRRYVKFDWDRFRPANDSLYAEVYRGLDGGAP